MTSNLPSALPLFFLAVLMFQCFEGCAMGSSAKASMNEQIAKLAKQDSATDWLTLEDLDKFQVGRPKIDILKDLQWRAGFVVAADCNGTAITAIYYALYTYGTKGDKLYVRTFIAVFENENFVKFIRPLPDTETIDYHGSRASRIRPRKAGDYSWLMRAIKSEPLTIPELQKEAQTITPPRKSIDPGLTVAYYIFAKPWLREPSKGKNYEMLRENAALRDQFNAARLNIGMTESDVQATLKAKPLESGKVEAGRYQIYGSNESFDSHDVWDWQHFPLFTNILVVFKEGEVTAIDSLESTYDWRKKVAEKYTDLPKPAAADSSTSSKATAKAPSANESEHRR